MQKSPKHKTFPGLAYLKLLAGSEASVSVPRSKREKFFFCPRGLLGYLLVAIFGTAFFLDLTDLFFRGTIRSTSFGKSNGILVTIGFSSSQVALFRVSVTSFFVVLSPKGLMSCMFHVLDISGRFKISKARYRTHTRYGWIYFFVVEAMSLARLVLVVLEIRREGTFWKLEYYSFFRLATGTSATYLFCMILLGNAISYPLIMAHYFACSLTCDCADALLQEMEDCAKDLSVLKVDTAKFTSKLKYFSAQHDMICDMFCAVDDVFRVKYLIDLFSGCVLELIVVTSFVATWTNVPTVTPFEAGRMATTAAAAFARFAILTVKPFELTAKGERFHEVVDSLLGNRQQSRRMDCASLEEYEASQTLERKIKTKSLTFTAGGILPIDRSAVSTVLFLSFGFFCFVLDRMENSHADNDGYFDCCRCRNHISNGTNAVTYTSIQAFTV